LQPFGQNLPERMYHFLAIYRETRGASEPRGRELKVCGTPALAIDRETRGALQLYSFRNVVLKLTCN